MPQPTARNRYKLAMERQRQRRRRLALRRLAALVLLLLVAGLVTVVVAGIRGCAQRRAALAARTPQPTPQVAAPREIELVFANDFRPGPAFVAVDSQRLYIGQPTVERDKVPATQLAAFAYGSDEPLWQAPAESPLLQLGVASGIIVGVPEAGGPLQRYSGATGEPLAAMDPGALQPQVQMDGRTVISGSTTIAAGGVVKARLTAFDPSNGNRAWTKPLALAGLTEGVDACCGAQAQVELNCWESLCAYRLHNVLGLFDPKSGKLLRKEYAAGGHIAALAVDRSKDGKQAYIVSADATDPALFRLVRIPLDDAYPPKRLLEFRSARGQFLLLGEAGNVLLAYSDEAGQARLACFRKGATEPALTLAADAGVIDMCAIPAAASEYLVALASRLNDDGEPVGRSRILRVRLAVPDYVEAGSYGRPVSWVVPFKEDCLALLRGGGLLGGGQILRYNAVNGKLKLLRRAKYDLLEPQHSADGTALLISSYPQSYMLGNGGPLQALVFK